MTRLKVHVERHAVSRIGWLRAAVLGANDGIVSTASLVVGVAAAEATRGPILLAAGAGLVAGAMSMAAGEYVSVASQADSEAADLARERAELATQPEEELEEMTAIYVARGLTPDLARQVAEQLNAGDALAAHARDELGISEHVTARPVQAALTSAATFAVGAAMPLVVSLLAPLPVIIPTISVATLVFLAVLGWLGARTGGASPWKPMLRVTFWGALALLVTAVIGKLFGAVV
ncbi:VIT1/CCC1 transporter family protein [Caulobacter vibrioides]|uniref:Nodulin-related protein n=2 Tax=Caulobacter vibrioides TaxID=155892 RepID=Q9AA89_CAUVC|nr:VIT family protein [Caulobacter vibrioides]YP_002516127.2 Nodulin-21 / CCC1-related protein [Caulobacter vibrioides NA1000]AAK22702.1 nodulin-related protein [Caulobacter vibrioides CB15]ACL94219.2 Nodulin-21 / CCC1-related protein [Caulobacter vibrioides NA1000]ATC27558.1 VIT family protein [Caulobacter vibrioides]QXZ52797.1 VIT family protein [Caulobacter vibrioides]